jgi:hypothetical protein
LEVLVCNDEMGRLLRQTAIDVDGELAALCDVHDAGDVNNAGIACCSDCYLSVRSRAKR